MTWNENETFRSVYCELSPSKFNFAAALGSKLKKIQGSIISSGQRARMCRIEEKHCLN